MSEVIGEVGFILLNVFYNVQVYHWSTSSYSRHKGSDYFLSEMKDKIDELIEILQGSLNDKIVIPASSMRVENSDDKGIIELLQTFRLWLIKGMLSKIERRRSIENVIDDMVGVVDKTLYLFSLN